MPKQQTKKEVNKKEASDQKRSGIKKKEKGTSKIREERLIEIAKAEKMKDERESLWRKVIKLGNQPNLTKNSPIHLMEYYVTDLELQQKRRMTYLSGMTDESFQIKNLRYAGIYNLVRMINKFENKTKPQFSVAVITNEGKSQYRTLTKDELIYAVENDNEVTQRELGSDAGEHLEYTLDWSKPFRVYQVTQKSDVVGHCNRQQNRVRTVGRCQVQDPKSDNNRCGYKCLEALGFKTNVKPRDQGGLSINQMKDLCEQHNFPIRIIDIQGHEVYQHKDHKDASLTLVMSVEEQHWFIFICFTQSKEEQREERKKKKQDEIEIKKLRKQQQKEEKMEKEEEKKLKRKKDLGVFWDVETVFNSSKDSLAQTFSLCYFPIILEQNMPKIFPDKLDKKGNVIRKSNIDYFLQKTMVEWGEDCVEKMVGQLTLKYPTDEYRYRFISFNGSCFDDYFLIDQAVKNEENILQCVFSSKSLIGLTLPYGDCWDLRKFLTMGSLKNLGQDYKIFPQKMEGFDHRLPQKAFDEGRLEQWIKENEQKIINYNKLDVLALYSLTIKFRESVFEIFKDKDGKVDYVYDPLNHYTLGGQSYAICVKKWREKNIYMPRAKSEEIDKYIRKCLTAGRTQVLASKDGKSVYINGKKFQMVDVVSLYPFVMMMKDNYYPFGDQTQVSQRDRSKLGFYHINVQHREDLPNVLPKRDYEGISPLNWVCKDKFETWCCSIDLDVLEAHGHWFEVLDGIEFSDRISGEELFQSQIQFRDEKLRQDVYKDCIPDRYNPALRNTCKLYLNSLSGKVIQRNFKQVTKIVYNQQSFNKFLDQCVDQSVYCSLVNQKLCVLNGEKRDTYSKQAKPSYLGVYIYAHARKFMYNEIYTKIKTFYTDTDSALVLYEDFLKFKEQFPHHFRKEKINIGGTEYEIKPFGTLDCEMKDYDITFDQYQQREWMYLYNETEETKKEWYDSIKKWVGANEAYLLAPKNYVVFNQKTEYYPKLKCKGVSFNGSYCWSCENSLKNLNILTLTRLNDKCQECDKGFCRYNSDDVPLYQDPIRLFETLASKKECEIKCDQLTIKTFTNHRNQAVGIQFRTIMKTISIESISRL